MKDIKSEIEEKKLEGVAGGFFTDGSPLSISCKVKIVTIPYSFAGGHTKAKVVASVSPDMIGVGTSIRIPELGIQTVVTEEKYPNDYHIEIWKFGHTSNVERYDSIDVVVD